MIKKGFPGEIRREATFEIKNIRTYMRVYSPESEHVKQSCMNPRTKLRIPPLSTSNRNPAYTTTVRDSSIAIFPDKKISSIIIWETMSNNEKKGNVM